MQTLEPANQCAADLYWLTFLLTGDREVSLDVTLEALGFAQGANPFFSTWMLAWSRRVVIAKALAVIRDELATSAHRTASKCAQEFTLPPRNWTPDQDSTKAVLERALLAIDVFPRCALLLSVFEGMPVEDVAILLDSDRDLVRKAQLTGLRALTRNLARMQGWTSTANRSYVVTSELQDA
jgi:DNA-directed RNA polymerase specialized sigma24 family protein